VLELNSHLHYCLYIMFVRSDYVDAIDIQAPSLYFFIIDNTIFDYASDAGS
jgi:hypothetical protein